MEPEITPLPKKTMPTLQRMLLELGILFLAFSLCLGYGIPRLISEKNTFVLSLGVILMVALAIWTVWFTIRLVREMIRKE